jgi:hypothetical protein
MAEKKRPAIERARERWGVRDTPLVLTSNPDTPRRLIFAGEILKEHTAAPDASFSHEAHERLMRDARNFKTEDIIAVFEPEKITALRNKKEWGLVLALANVLAERGVI